MMKPKWDGGRGDCVCVWECLTFLTVVPVQCQALPFEFGHRNKWLKRGLVYLKKRLYRREVIQPWLKPMKNCCLLFWWCLSFWISLVSHIEITWIAIVIMHSHCVPSAINMVWCFGNFRSSILWRRLTAEESHCSSLETNYNPKM